MAAIVRAVRRMSLKSIDLSSEDMCHDPDEGYAATAKSMEIRDRGRKVKSSKKEIKLLRIYSDFIIDTKVKK